MTRSQRIDQAACEMAMIFGSASQEEAERVLTVAFPELLSSPATHWIAPVAADDGMWQAMYEAQDVGEQFEAARDAYLNRP